MNLLIFADVSAAHVIGGAERVLHAQSTRLVRKGHRVDIITRKYPHHHSGHQNIEGVEEWRYPATHNNAFSYLATTIKNSRFLFDLVYRQHPVDCINAHQPFTAFGILKILQSHKIPMVYTCHSLSFEEFRSRRENRAGLKGPLYQVEIWCRKYIEKKVLRAADRIIVLSEFTKQKLCTQHQLGAETISIVPGGVDLSRFHPAPDKTKARRRLNAPLDKFILFTVRNLVPRMGLENLIRAVGIIVEKVPDILLILGGAGSLENNLKQLLKETGTEKYIRIEGFIPEDQLPVYYRMADAFILPTQELEGFGLVTIEALASGLPVFGTPVGGTCEILSQLHEDYLFADRSPEAMAKSIISYYDRVKRNPPLEKDVSNKCRDFAQKNYSWDKNIDTLESIFIRLTRS